MIFTGGVGFRCPSRGPKSVKGVSKVICLKNSCFSVTFETPVMKKVFWDPLDGQRGTPRLTAISPYIAHILSSHSPFPLLPPLLSLKEIKWRLIAIFSISQTRVARSKARTRPVDDSGPCLKCLHTRVADPGPDTVFKPGPDLLVQTFSLVGLEPTFSWRAGFGFSFSLRFGSGSVLWWLDPDPACLEDQIWITYFFDDQIRIKFRGSNPYSIHVDDQIFIQFFFLLENWIQIRSFAGRIHGSAYTSGGLPYLGNVPFRLILKPSIVHYTVLCAFLGF